MAPVVSVIVPAFEAERTLADTLESLARQSLGDWEAIIVDDGSSDGTAALAGQWVGRDGRLRLTRRPHEGVSAARNAGLAEARGELVLFLDADDLLHPTMLERMSGALRESPEAVAAYCGWSRLAPDGRVQPHPFFRTSGDLFPVLAGIQPFAVHTCLARRAEVLEVGGFDPGLTTCEDWDLWQRLARTGKPFACVSEVLCLYRTKLGSASQDPRRMLLDGLRLVRQGCSADPRVPRPAPSWANGVGEATLRPHRYRLLSWSAGLAIGRGQSALELCPELGEAPCPWLAPQVVSDALIQAVLLPAGLGPEAWGELWTRHEPALQSFAGELESRSGSPNLARAVLTHLEAAVGAQVRRPIKVGRSWALDFDPYSPGVELEAPAPIERVRLYASLPNEGTHGLELPLFDGRLPAGVVSDALAAELTWPLLRAYFRERVEPELRWVELPEGTAVWRGPTCLADKLPVGREAAAQALLTQHGWALFLQELWGRPHWPLSRFYELGPDETTFPLRVHGSVLELEISEELPDLELVQPELDLRVRVGGVPIGELRLVADGGRVSAARLRAEITIAAGFELARSAVREGLLGRPLSAGESLRHQLRVRARGPREQPPAGAILARRARRELDTPISRRVKLPASALGELARAARGAGEPFFEAWPSAPEVCYLPGALHPLAPAQAEPDPSPPAEGEAGGRRTERLPILVYHRIALRGPQADEPFRTSPRVFEEQLAMLRALGYRGLCLREWRAAMVRHSPVPGRAVLFTFDDATADFAETAWPLLKRYGFGAMLFVPTDAVDAGVYFDRITGAQLPILGWDELARLAAEGVEIGSHTRSHCSLTRVSPEQAVLELAGSRARLQERLGRPVHSVAYPFGDESPLVHHLAAGCGYLYGLTCRPSPAGLWDPLLALPRLEVSRDPVGELARKLELAAPAPVVQRSP